ncbi:type II toxin-antitoxin system VapB family antitoxin [Inquilinus sp. OTU3971]|uniref:type II toxin-antitoxin system VapB family antitoxin n=1 Tax=Inquilinus sp. OTU3971 TaxID=3043855 RepID=UPI00313A85EE
MALSIKDPETEMLARALAQRTGESITEAIRRALEDRLRRVASAQKAPVLLEDLAAIRKRVAALPVLDRHSPDEILGYDEHGRPG